MKCKYCGEIQNENMNYCEKCGKPLDKKAEKKYNIAYLFIVIIVFIIFIDAINIFNDYQSKDNQSKSEKNVNLENKDIKQEPVITEENEEENKAEKEKVANTQTKEQTHTYLEEIQILVPSYLEEINNRINGYSHVLLRAQHDMRGKNVLEEKRYKFSLINWTVSPRKTYSEGEKQSYFYTTYDDYKSQYELLYGDSSNMDQEMQGLGMLYGELNNDDLGSGYVSWMSNWAPMSTTSIEFYAQEKIDEQNGYTVRGYFIVESEDEAKKSLRTFEIKYATNGSRDWLTSIILY